MARLKYMGSAHRRVFEKGVTFNNRLSEPIEQDIVFDLASGHVIDTHGLHDAVVQVLLEDPNIVDVSKFEVAPTGLAEELWYATPKSEGRERGTTLPLPLDDPTSPGSEGDKAKGDKPKP